ncbi:Uncharacterized conserved protein [Phaffia rhodozyma]|uniref:Uncharacterized conserved protein n=1 Tax=Phaffia rhodozyma TaxID=264483 RepID=A0A0F7SSC2_PHARH|nr:Uncharacterized conserved protein [Phaffia rhodozyma]
MGADGGSIPDRRDLVKNKPKAQQTDGENLRRAQWSSCALSKRSLRSPIVLDALGRMYNKDAMLEFLLDRSSYGDGESICGHIRGFKDLLTIQLTPNPNFYSPSADETSDVTAPKFPFSCPLTQREANGTTPFVALRPCGDVFSEAGLKATLTTSSVVQPKSPSTMTADTSPSPSDEKSRMYACPTCSTSFRPTFIRSTDKDQAAELLNGDIIYLNSSFGLQEDLLILINAARAEEKAAKKNKKRKSGAVAAGDDGDSAGAEKTTHKKAKAKTEMNGNGGRVGLIAKAVADELKAAEEKRKAGGMSDAVKSLYAGKKGKEEDNFITRGTFTRYA